MKKEKSMKPKDNMLKELKGTQTFMKCEVSYNTNYQESSTKYESFNHTYMSLMRS